MPINQITVDKNISFFEALSFISKSGSKTLIILNKNRTIYGLITEGTIRKQILKNINLTTSINKFINKKFFYVYENKFDREKISKLFSEKKYELIPIIDSKKKYTGFLEWSDFLKNKINKKNLGIPVIFMSGGKGLRMKPISISIPKPLIPFKDKTIIETILDNFKEEGVSNFYFILNHKHKLLKNYLQSIKIKEKFSYLIEKQELGTAGGLFFLKKENLDIFVVSNCDTLIKSSLHEMISFHKSKKYDITVIVAAKEYQLPYGVLDVNKNGTFKSIDEKPKTEILTNTGLYIMSKNCLKLLRSPKKIDMNEMLILFKKKGMKIGVFPIIDHKWFDFGQWNEYERTLSNL